MRYPDEEQTSSREHLPQKPYPVHDRSRRSSKRYDEPRRDERRRERSDRDRERVRGSPEKKPRSDSRERRHRERRAARRAQETDEDRDERRRQRAAQDPERDARREERRNERRAIREERRRLKEREIELGRSSSEIGAKVEPQGATQEAIKTPSPETPAQDAPLSPPSPSGPTPPPVDWQDGSLESSLESVESKRYYASSPPKQDYFGHHDRQDRDLEYGEPRRSSRPRHSRRQSSRHHSRPPPRAQSFHSSADDWSDYDEKHAYSRSRSHSMYDELNYYKRTTAPDRYDRYHHDRRSCCCGCRRKWTILGIISAILIMIIIIVVAVVVSKNNKYTYNPSTAQVNNTAAFTSGGATHASVNNTKDGIGAGNDVYKYYQGNATNFPNQTLWISFEDMWNNNLPNIKQSCGWLNYGADDTDQDTTDIYNAIQDRANASLVDHRLILALVLQESHGCVRVSHTTSSGGVKNTGLMQAHDGTKYDSSHARLSIMEMIQDGTQGTKKGNGLVQELNMYGDPYKAARAYNSGYIPTSGDLSEAAGATACYVSDVANRLTGWVKAQTACPGGT